MLVAVLELVSDGVCVVWVGLLEKPIEVVRRWPHRTLVATRSGRDAPHVGATHLLVVAIIAVGHGHSPLKALFAPLVAAFDALLGAVSGDIRRRLLVAARCHLPASLCRAKHDRLIAGGALGGNAVRLLKQASKEVVMSALLWALCATFRQRTCTSLVSLVVNLWFASPSLSLPWQGLG
jgi:hypothetical protein